MKEKYIEESFRRYFIFGESANGQYVDVADSEGDIVTHIRRDEAERLIVDRNIVVDALIRCIQLHGEKAYEVYRKMADKLVEVN